MMQSCQSWEESIPVSDENPRENEMFKAEMEAYVVDHDCSLIGLPPISSLETFQLENQLYKHNRGDKYLASLQRQGIY